MKAYKIELLVIDFENAGINDITDMIENARYPNRCISPNIKKVSEADIGDWSDDHPLNKPSLCEEEYERLFNGK